MTIYLDSQEVRRLLREACEAEGSQKAWAKKHDLSVSYVSDVVLGYVDPGPSILDAMRLVRVIRYRKKSVAKKVSKW